jgi:hypothetical protein
LLPSFFDVLLYILLSSQVLLLVWRRLTTTDNEISDLGACALADALAAGSVAVKRIDLGRLRLLSLSV